MLRRRRPTERAASAALREARPGARPAYGPRQAGAGRGRPSPRGGWRRVLQRAGRAAGARSEGGAGGGPGCCAAPRLCLRGSGVRLASALARPAGLPACPLGGLLPQPGGSGRGPAGLCSAETAPRQPPAPGRGEAEGRGAAGAKPPSSAVPDELGGGMECGESKRESGLNATGRG